jgi:hypothetical protein
MMTRVRLLLAALLAVSALAVIAVPAGAAVPAANTKFCTAYKKIGQGTQGLSSPAAARATLAKFKAAGKYAPAKVKKASNTIVSVLSNYAKITAGNAGDVANFLKSSQYKDYGKAVTTYFLYADQQCTPTS